MEDIEAANGLIKEILLRKSDELNTACRKYFEYLKAYLKSENKTAFTAKEVRQDLRINHSNQKRYMLHLLYNNYIQKSTGTKAKGYTYEVVSMEEYEQLKNSIGTVLDEVLQKVRKQINTPGGSPEINTRGGSPQKNLSHKNKVNSSIVVQQQNEPLKPNSRKEKGEKFKSSAKEVSDRINLTTHETVGS